MATKKPIRKPSRVAKRKPTVKPAKKQPIPVPAKNALLVAIPKASRVLFTANGAAALVVRDAQKSLSLFDLATKTETPPLKTLPTASTVALSADTRLIAIGTSTGILAVDSTQAGKIAWKTKATGKPIAQVLFTLDGSLILAADAPKDESDSWIRVLKTATGEVDTSFDPIAGARVGHLALAPDGFFLAHSELRSGSVLIWHLPTRQVAACVQLQKSNGPIVALSFGLNVRHLFVAQVNRLSAWNGENALPLADMAAEGLSSLAVLCRGTILASLRSGPQGSAVNIWNSETAHLRNTLHLPPGEYGTLAAPPDGSALALPGGKECWIWSAEKLVC